MQSGAQRLWKTKSAKGGFRLLLESDETKCSKASAGLLKA
jgi:hypothetical protein